MSELKSVYFEKAGKDNTEETLKIAKKFAEKKGIKDIVVASTVGETGVQAAKIFPTNDYNLVVVTHSYGFMKNIKQELDDNNRAILEKNNVKILSGTHAFSGVERAFRTGLKPQIWFPVELMAKTIRSVFGEGTKVCMEIAIMAADAGLIDMESDVICIGGTGRGADTALILKPAYSSYFLKMKVREIICKPRDF
ncbi:MAG: pyruvate kinase alpha/beta domain-containing protein [Candidatus Hodarchaeota archaeon]